MKKNISDKDIVSTLSFGDNFSTFKFVLMWISIVICIAGSIALIIVSRIENNQDDLLAAFIPIVLLIVPISFLSFGFKRRKKIKLWLADAIILDASCELTVDYFDGLNSGEKVLIVFTYNSEQLIRMSKFRYQHPLTFSINGYSNTYKKYIGHNIKILYSPKYDEVMIPNQHIV